MPHPTFSVIARIVTLVSLAYLVLSAAVVSDLHLFFKEGHGVEELSLALLMFGIGLWFLLAGEHRFREWQIPAAMALMLAREMDFDKRFTDHGLLKLTTYTHDAPMGTKIVGGIAILFTLWVGLRIIRRNVPLWWSRLRGGHADAWLLTGAFVLGVVAKSIDGLGRKLLPLGVHVPEAVNSFAGQAEEVFEVICYYLIVLAVARLATVLPLRARSHVAAE